MGMWVSMWSIIYAVVHRMQEDERGVKSVDLKRIGNKYQTENILLLGDPINTFYFYSLSSTVVASSVVVMVTLFTFPYYHPWTDRGNSYYTVTACTIQSLMVSWFQVSGATSTRPIVTTYILGKKPKAITSNL